MRLPSLRSFTGARTRASIAASVCLALSSLACGGSSASDGAPNESVDRTLTVFTAGSLARPVRAALDSFAAQTGARFAMESAGSLETARKLTELGKIPDVIALADEEVFPQLLIPRHVRWYARFAQNRMVLAYTDRSRHASEVDSTNWWRLLQRPGLEIGRSDPDLDPAGYRTLLLFQLAAAHYGQPSLAVALERAAAPRNMRPKEAELTALLQAGELDYAWTYESLAKSNDLRFVVLPKEIDLGSTADSLGYGRAKVKVRGKTRSATIEFVGRPISYALSIPVDAANSVLAERFVAFLLSDAGRRALRREFLDAVDAPSIVGTGAPEAIANVGSR